MTKRQMTMGEIVKHKDELEREVWQGYNPSRSKNAPPEDVQDFEHGFRSAFRLWEEAFNELKRDLRATGWIS